MSSWAPTTNVSKHVARLQVMTPFVSYKLRIIQIEPSKCSGLLGHLWRKMWRCPIRQTTCLVFGSRFQSACIQIENPSHMLFSPSNTVIYFLLFTMAGQNQMKKISVSSSFHARPPWCCSTGKSNQTITERGSCTREPWWPAPDPLSCNLCRNLAVHKPSWHLVHNYIILYIYIIYSCYFIGCQKLMHCYKCMYIYIYIHHISVYMWYIHMFTIYVYIYIYLNICLWNVTFIDL